jgi:hypothetical protein
MLEIVYLGGVRKEIMTYRICIRKIPRRKICGGEKNLALRTLLLHLLKEHDNE